MASSESAGLITKADAPEPAGAALARWRVLAGAALAMLLVGCGASMLTFLYAMDDEQARVSIKVATGISATQYSLLAGYTQGGAALLSQLAIGFLPPLSRRASAGGALLAVAAVVLPARARARGPRSPSRCSGSARARRA